MALGAEVRSWELIAGPKLSTESKILKYLLAASAAKNYKKKNT